MNFLNTDVNNIVTDQPFDAAVGRFILTFLPDPISVLRSVAGLVRPGGVLAFQEPSWTAMLALGARLPLWSRVRHLIHETLLRSGANPEMGLALYPVFQEVGLPAPKMHLEMPLGSDADFIRLTSDLLCSLRPLAEQHGVSLEELGRPRYASRQNLCRGCCSEHGSKSHRRWSAPGRASRRTARDQRTRQMKSRKFRPIRAAAPVISPIGVDQLHRSRQPLDRRAAAEG